MTVLSLLIVLCIGEVIGFLVGRNQHKLEYKIAQLSLPKEPEVKPSVSGGAYEPPKDYFNTDDTTPTGLVEVKTPQQVEFEAEQRIEKQVLGR